MYSIKKAGPADAGILRSLAIQTFLESHGHSAPKEDIDRYVAGTYSLPVIETELANEHNLYHLLYFQNTPAGFSRLVLDTGYPEVPIEPVAKLDRIYVLEAFHGQKLGLALLQYNIDIAREANQKGLWLYTWKKNLRAISFYERAGFVITGSFDFPISPTHSNPNHRMLLTFPAKR